ncbi:MAG: histidine phosphatase family protein [Patescibacteria group bacterium]
MAWPKLLVLVRHAESKSNVLSANERASFETAPHTYPLTERGRQQAAVTAAYLQRRFGRFDTRYTSYYGRAKETMEILCPGEKYCEDPRLAEAQRGIWHAMTRDEIRERFPEEIRRRDREGFYHHRPIGGENWPDVELRIRSFLDTLTRDHAGARVLLVVHSHWLVLCQRLIHGYSIEECVRRYREQLVENASVTAYAGHDPWLFGRPSLELTLDAVVPWKDLLP